MAAPELLESIAFAVDLEENTPWARVGDDYERRVVDELTATAQVVRPVAKQRMTRTQTIEFLRGKGAHRYAHQAWLELPPAEMLLGAIRTRWGVPEEVRLSPGFPDLLEKVTRDGEIAGFRLIDIKAVHHATLFHRAQVAYYALLLEAILASEGIPIPVLPEAEIWHLDPSGRSAPVKASFRLEGYMAQVSEFLQRTLPRLAMVPLERDRDETQFHVYFKCEQCPYLPHCRKSVANDLSAEALDLSSVPGMSGQTKQTLINQLGVRSVAGLAARPIAGDAEMAPDVDLRRQPGANWSLRMSGDVLVHRARAIVKNEVRRLPDRYTHQMPGDFELGIYLVVDHDPVEGRLAALGCRCEWTGRDPVTVVESVSVGGPEAERHALTKILTTVVDTLSAADEHNTSGAAASVRAHLFFYEPSEATDLAAALGRHLADPMLCSGLLHMLRMFPPSELPPEPQYKGEQHLPATSLRNVIDALFALPVRVSHDLRSVTAALASATPALTEQYVPAVQFARPFSSRLNIDACRRLKAGTLGSDAVCDDVERRLRAIASLAAWLTRCNAQPNGRFLRLNKQPFRWQATLNPLAAGDLDLLRAHELLQLRTAELQALVALAAPWQLRRDRMKCFSRLKLIKAIESPSGWVDLRLHFAVPPDSRKAELAPGTVGLILTDDNPDLRLDLRAWQKVFVNLVSLRSNGGDVELIVDVENAGPIWKELRKRTAQDGWFLDQAHRELNAERMDNFLQYLAGSAAPSPRSDS